MALAARRPETLASLAEEIGALAVACDATIRGDVDRLFAELRGRWQQLDVVLYNASYRIGGPLVDLDPADVERSLVVCAYGGFLVAQQAARWMLRQGSGAILFTGASASVKGYARSAPFAMGKFALRGLAQSMARELSPQNIHAAHFVIDGVVRRSGGRGGRSCRQRARSRCDRRNLPRHPRPAAQRLDLGGRAVPLGRAVLRRRLVGVVVRSASLSRASVGPPYPRVSWAISMRVTAAGNALYACGPTPR